MKRLGHNLESAGILVSTTVGAGVFSLPYLFEKSGWVTGAFYLLFLGAVMAVCHGIYWESLERTGARNLLALTRKTSGKIWSWFGAVTICGGLLFALVAYLILGAHFVLLILPSISWIAALLIFSAIASSPFLFGLQRIVTAELVGAFSMAAIIVFIFFLGLVGGNGEERPPAIVSQNALLPFGAILFSLAGWTAIGPMREAEGKSGGKKFRVKSLAWGTAAVVILYILFVASVFQIATQVTPDTVSGLFALPRWVLVLMGILGIFTLWTSYLPIGLEAVDSLTGDLGLRSGFALFAVTGLPLLGVLAGLSDFLRVLGFAGGVFLSLQYLLIVYAGERALKPRGAKKALYWALSLFFFLGAAHEAYYFFS